MSHPLHPLVCDVDSRGYMASSSSSSSLSASSPSSSVVVVSPGTQRLGSLGKQVLARTMITPARMAPSVPVLSDGIQYCKLERSYSTNLRKDGRSYHLGMFPGEEGDPTAIRLALKR